MRTRESPRVTPDDLPAMMGLDVLVYGTSLGGTYRQSWQRYIGVGPKSIGRIHDRAYGLPIFTPSGSLLPPEKARQHVAAFINCVTAHPTHRFYVTRLGGHPREVASLFAGHPLPRNLSLPQDYWYVIDLLNTPAPAAESTPRPRNASRNRYAAYLQTQHWAALRDAAFERWGRFCINCPNDDLVEAHHVRYRPRLEDCTTDDVVPLCRVCHEHFHVEKKRNPGLAAQIALHLDPREMIDALRKFLRSTGCHPGPRRPIEMNASRLSPPTHRKWVTPKQ